MTRKNPYLPVRPQTMRQFMMVQQPEIDRYSNKKGLHVAEARKKLKRAKLLEALGTMRTVTELRELFLIALEEDII